MTAISAKNAYSLKAGRKIESNQFVMVQLQPIDEETSCVSPTKLETAIQYPCFTEETSKTNTVIFSRDCQDETAMDESLPSHAEDNSIDSGNGRAKLSDSYSG